MEYNVSPDADYDARLRQRLEGLFSEASQIRRGYKPRDPYAPWVPKKSPAENALEYQRKSEEYKKPKYDEDLDELIGDPEEYQEQLNRGIDFDMAVKKSTAAGEEGRGVRGLRKAANEERTERREARRARRNPGRVSEGATGAVIEGDDGLDELMTNPNYIPKAETRRQAMEMLEDSNNQGDIDELMEIDALDPLIDGELETEEERKERLRREEAAKRGTVR